MGRPFDFLDDLQRDVLHAVHGIDRRLADEIDGAQAECVESDAGALLSQGGAHDNRHGMQSHEVAQEFQAIHARHLDVQRQYIRVQRLDHVARHDGIFRRADDFDLFVRGEDFREQPPNHQGIVDDQNANFFSIAISWA